MKLVTTIRPLRASTPASGCTRCLRVFSDGTAIVARSMDWMGDPGARRPCRTGEATGMAAVLEGDGSQREKGRCTANCSGSPKVTHQKVSSAPGVQATPIPISL
jgi:hypothetical protein